MTASGGAVNTEYFILTLVQLMSNDANKVTQDKDSLQNLVSSGDPIPPDLLSERQNSEWQTTLAVIQNISRI